MSRLRKLPFALFSSVSSAALAVPSIQTDAPVVAEARPFHGPLHVEARVGGGTTVGLVGVVAEWNVAEVLALGAGIGTNGWPVVGASARARLPVWRTSKYQQALTLEPGYSRGKYQGGADLYPGACLHSDRCLVELVPETVHWLQAEVGWELRARSGITFRAATGAAWLMNSIDWRCTKEGEPAACEGKSAETTLSVLTLALGYAF
jgi:hypothetical protein